MNWNELELIWKCQAPAAGTDPEVLRQTFEARQQRFSRAFFQRDVKGAVILVAVAGYFAYKGWQSGPAYWPIGVAVALLLGLAAFFLLERLHARRLRLGPDAPLLAKLDADIAELHHQRRLLLNIVTWFLTPMWTAVAIILATCFFNRPALLHDLSQMFFWAGYVVVCGLINWITWTINWRFARLRVEPRLAELERLRDHLLSAK